MRGGSLQHGEPRGAVGGCSLPRPKKERRGQRKLLPAGRVLNATATAVRPSPRPAGWRPGERPFPSAPPGKAGGRPGAHKLHPQSRLRRGGERYFARPLGRGRACLPACLCGEPAPPFCAAMSGWAGQPPLRELSVLPGKGDPQTPPSQAPRPRRPRGWKHLASRPCA